MEEPALQLRCLDLDGVAPGSLASDLKHWLSVLGENRDETEVSIVSATEAETSCAFGSRDFEIGLCLFGDTLV